GPLLMPVVDYAPRIACIGVAALQGPIFGSIADLFQPANFGPFVVSPVRAGKWNNRHNWFWYTEMARGPVQEFLALTGAGKLGTTFGRWVFRCADAPPN